MHAPDDAPAAKTRFGSAPFSVITYWTICTIDASSPPRVGVAFQQFFPPPTLGATTMKPCISDRLWSQP